MTTTTYDSVDLCAVRVTQLTEAGAPITGAAHGYVSQAPITLDIKIVTEAGDDKTQKNGCGSICATLQSPDQIKGLTLDAEFCQLDAYLFEFLTGAQTFSTGGNAIGQQFAAVGANPPPICFEGWSKAWTVDHQATDAFTSPNATYIHWVFPLTRWVQGDIKLAHDLTIFPASCKGSENTKITANGPYDDWPSAVASAGGVTRVGGWFFDGTLPTQTGAKIAVTSAAS